MRPQSIGSTIKTLRMRHEMTQRDLAVFLSVTSSTISNWEHERRMPSISELRRLSEVFKVSLDTFAISQNSTTAATKFPDINRTNGTEVMRTIHFDEIPRPLTLMTTSIFLILITWIYSTPFTSHFIEAFSFFACSFGLIGLILGQSLKNGILSQSKHHNLMIPKSSAIFFDLPLHESKHKTTLLRALTIGFSLLTFTKLTLIVTEMTKLGYLTTTLTIVLPSLCAIGFSFIGLSHIIVRDQKTTHLAYDETRHKVYSGAFRLAMSFECFSAILYGLFSLLFIETYHVGGLTFLTSVIGILAAASSVMMTRCHALQLKNASLCYQHVNDDIVTLI